MLEEEALLKKGTGNVKTAGISIFLGERCVIGVTIERVHKEKAGVEVEVGVERRVEVEVEAIPDQTIEKRGI